jgi:hypothetical protein
MTVMPQKQAAERSGGSTIKKLAERTSYAISHHSYRTDR